MERRTKGALSHRLTNSRTWDKDMGQVPVTRTSDLGHGARTRTWDKDMGHGARTWGKDMGQGHGT